MKFLKLLLMCLMSQTIAISAFGASTIFEAVQSSNLPEVARFVEKVGVDVNVTDAAKLTPLFWAINNFSIAKYLLDKGANPNAVDKTGLPPIYYATKNGNERVVRLLLSEKANVAFKVNWDAKTKISFVEYAQLQCAAGWEDDLQVLSIMREIRDTYVAKNLSIGISKAGAPIFKDFFSEKPVLKEVIFGATSSAKKAVQAGDPVVGPTHMHFSPVTAAIILDKPEAFSYFLDAGFVTQEDSNNPDRVQQPFQLVARTIIHTGFGYKVLDSMLASLSQEVTAKQFDYVNWFGPYIADFVKYLVDRKYDFTWTDKDGTTLVGAALSVFEAENSDVEGSALLLDAIWPSVSQETIAGTKGFYSGIKNNMGGSEERVINYLKGKNYDFTWVDGDGLTLDTAQEAR